MKSITLLLCCLFYVFIGVAQNQPNILWIITDDHRPDAIEYYNEVTTGKSESALGFVMSPNINKLAKEGTIFVNSFCNSAACGPSRGSMISGRYPFKTDHHGFKLTHQNPDFVKPSFPQILREEGYASAQFGKTGEYIYRWGPGQGFHDAKHYDYMMHFKHSLQKNEVGDLWGHNPYLMEDGKVVYQGTQECVKRKDGSVERYFVHRLDGKISDEDIVKKKEIEEEFDILRSYTRSNPNLILGGENPMPADKTVDAMIVHEFNSYLSNENIKYKTSYGDTVSGADTKKPLLVNLGFHLPHTPVLPPKKFREIFQKKSYQIPAFDTTKIKNYPPQIVKLFKDLDMTRMTDAEKQQAIQDYYAFCAHGDALIGQAVQNFKAYSNRNNQEYLIVFTVGDHGWHLGEQGIEAKFGPWQQSVNGAIIMVSSDKDLVPAGQVNKRLVEYVDLAPTLLSQGGVNIKDPFYQYLDGINLFETLESDQPTRDYILGEINLVAGPRAYLRGNDFSFSMRTRPTDHPTLNENIQWALTCPVEEVELLLYDLRKDPHELHNVATDDAYKELARWFRKKLGNIVLGDGRIECDWSKANTYRLSEFAKGAHDRKLDIPHKIIPPANE